MNTSAESAVLHYRKMLARERTQRSAGQPAWLADIRDAAVARFERDGFPGARDEDWRYTSLDFLGQQVFEVVNPDGDTPPDLQDIADLTLTDTPTTRVVFVNGRFNRVLSDLTRLAPGVVVEELDEAISRDAAVIREHFTSLGRGDGAMDAFGALNTALTEGGVFVAVGDGVTVDTPIELLHVSVRTAEPRMMHPRHVVAMGAGSRATLVERYVTVNDSHHFTNAMVHVRVGEGAVLTHERAQEESPDAYHLAAVRVEQAQNSRYRQVTASLGGAWARTGIRVEFEGEGAVAELDGLYLAGDRQLNDIHLDVRHEVPNCESQERFRGILDGRGRAVFDGRVFVARDAQGTNARLSNDNLLLSRNAEVDTKPQLEIYADDVRCSHGTTVGQLDEAMIFYLRSRGIGPEEARQMLCLGFAGESIDAFSSEALKGRVEAGLRHRLMVLPFSTN